MMRERTTRTLAHYLRRAVEESRRHGWSAVAAQAWNRFGPDIRQIHLLVVIHELPSISSSAGEAVNHREASVEPEQAAVPDFHIRKITDPDDPALDTLARIDEWGTSKSLMLADLRDGSHCFVAMSGDEVIAAQWATQKVGFFDSHLRREFDLAENESYAWRGYCAPSWRGYGVMPSLLGHVMIDLARTNGKTRWSGLVRTGNTPMIRSLRKIGWQVVGRAGFLEAFGIRFHYLLGRDAFPQTRRRNFLQSHR